MLDYAAEQITRYKNLSLMLLVKLIRDNFDVILNQSNEAFISADVSCKLSPYQYKNCANLHTYME